MLRNTFLVARVWRLPLLIGAGAACILAWGLITNPITVPGRTSVSEDVWPLIPALFAAAAANSASRLQDPLERTAVLSLALRKMTAVGIAVVVGSLISISALGQVDAGVAVRNTYLLLGLGYGVLAYFGRPAALLTVVMVPVCMWIVGSQGQDLPPAPWAILLYRWSPGSLFVGLFTLAIGIVAFLVRPEPRTTVDV